MPTGEPERGACDRCRTQPVVRHSISVVGPLDIREDHLCLACQSIVDQEAEAAALREPNLTHLGPIDFEILRASFGRAEAEERADPGVLELAMEEVLSIARQYGQTLPPDVADFMRRHSS